ncbi:MAG: trypsin-like peptidase domain-containing protein [Candidatus Harrisonbacteria bacterium]|nr:trypsin-like peptidase domain-containing protein [Candidatus Harrisonbacteria bacterium]
MYFTRLAGVLLLALLFSSCATQSKFFEADAFSESEKAIGEKLHQEADYLALIKCVQWEQSGSQWLGYKSVLSGAIFKKNGKYWILTAGHIRMPGEKTTSIEVCFKNQKDKYYKAKIFYREFQKSVSGVDLAILEIQDKDFTFTGKTAVFGDSGKIQLGDLVVSLGHPDDHFWFYSLGRIKDMFYKNGSAAPYQLEHAAWSGYGGSGGPILNKDGEVIGMNIMIYVGKQFSISTRVTALTSETIKKVIETKLP